MTIRRAVPTDRDALGRLGAMLMHTHYDFDRQRFIKPGEDAADGYGEFLVSQLDDHETVVLVADSDGHIDGYLYAAIEPLSWKELRDRAGYIHDIAVDSPNRRHGTAHALMIEAMKWFREQKVPRAILGTSPLNVAARAAFSHFGFRDTLIEMTLELE